MDGIQMSVRAARRLGLVEAAEAGQISNAEGAERARVSLRQFKRLRQRYRERGPTALVHGNRGRRSPRRLAPELFEAIERLLRGETRLNDCHVRDLLAERGARVSAEAVRQVRRRLGLPPKHRRRSARYYARRERAARSGALVLIDGSPFAWFGSDQPPCSLIGTIDDATGIPLSGCFRAQEDMHGWTTALRNLIVTNGVPEALYGDGTNIAVRNDARWSLEEELAGRQRATQFGQILEELGIRYVRARSPEAKGRIERMWRTFQDRLTAEFALQGIRSAEQAEPFLPQFFARYRGWFSHAPRDSQPAWKPAPAHLDHILACRYERLVARDNTVTVGSRTVQIPPRNRQRSWFGTRVEFRELLDGRALILHDGAVLAEQSPLQGTFTLENRRSGRNRRLALRSPAPPRAAKPTYEAPVTKPRPKPPVPGQNHPWRRGYDPSLLPKRARA